MATAAAAAADQQLALGKKLFYYCPVVLSNYMTAEQTIRAVDNWRTDQFPSALPKKHNLHATVLYVGRIENSDAVHAANLPKKYAHTKLEGTVHAVDNFYVQETKETVVVLSFDCEAQQDLHAAMMKDAEALSGVVIRKPVHRRPDGTLPKHGFSPHVTIATYADKDAFQREWDAAVAANTFADMVGMKVRLEPVQEFYE